MKKEDLERYLENKTRIQLKLAPKEFFYKGTITYLNETSMVFKDDKLGEITIDYTDIMSPIIPLEVKKCKE